MDLIAQIHASPTMAVIVMTGGGTRALADLLAIPGASKTVLEALVPYSERSLAEFLGAFPTQSVSIETAAAMAQAAYRRAVHLQDDVTIPVVGLSCTATLVTDRPKKGDHRAHLGVCSSLSSKVCTLTLTKGARDRQGEERVISSLLLNILAEVCGLETQNDIGLLPDERVHITATP
jgi:hypothetical protein